MRASESRLWAIMSPAGFVTSFLSARHLIAEMPSPVSVLTLLGMAIALSGLSGIIYTIFFLSASWTRQVDGFTSEGIYSLVRHPLYLSGIIMNIGIILTGGSAHGWLCLGFHPFAIVGIGFYLMAAKLEDSYNIAKFGESYRRYTDRVSGLNPAGRLFARKTSDQ